ncbi:spore wall and anchoring disk complex protein 1 [Vairimorpha necatrix]|uniref:Spore wall and anchoring disk complex protein 1 n=1 Tax=Vairimorpha necatrix TaxID=6039 RepID=A0AAX4JEU8_9MICR
MKIALFILSVVRAFLPILIEGDGCDDPYEICRKSSGIGVVANAKNVVFLMNILKEAKVESAFVYGWENNKKLMVLTWNGTLSPYIKNRNTSRYAFCIAACPCKPRTVQEKTHIVIPSAEICTKPAPIHNTPAITHQSGVTQNQHVQIPAQYVPKPCCQSNNAPTQCNESIYGPIQHNQSHKATSPCCETNFPSPCCEVNVPTSCCEANYLPSPCYESNYNNSNCHKYAYPTHQHEKYKCCDTNILSYLKEKVLCERPRSYHCNKRYDNHNIPRCFLPCESSSSEDCRYVCNESSSQEHEYLHVKCKPIANQKCEYEKCYDNYGYPYGLSKSNSSNSKVYEISFIDENSFKLVEIDKLYCKIETTYSLHEDDEYRPNRIPELLYHPLKLYDIQCELNATYNQNVCLYITDCNELLVIISKKIYHVILEHSKSRVDLESVSEEEYEELVERGLYKVSFRD